MKLNDLQVFLSVVQNRSISEAARKQHLTQPAVSSIISSIEKEVGQILIIRQIRGKQHFELTKAGSVFMKYALRTLDLYREMESEMARVGGLSDSITIGSGRSNSVHILPTIVKCFKDKHPNIPVTINTYTNTYVAHEKLSLMEYDLSISNFLPDSDDLIAEKFLYDPIVFICPNHMNIRDYITVNTLKKLPLVMRTDSMNSRELLTIGLEKHHLTLNDLNIVMQVYGDSAVKQAVSMGTGCGFIPRSLAYIDLAAYPAFKVIQIKNLKLDRNIYLVRNKNSHVTKSIKTFYNFVINTDWSKKLPTSF